MRLGNLDGAVIAALQADAALTAIATDGVWYGNGAMVTARRFVTIMRMQGHVEPEFDPIAAYYDLPYQIRCVLQTKSTTDVNTAAERIHAVLNRNEPAIVATGFRTLYCELEFPIRYDQIDTSNPDIHWQHAGGQYRLWVMPTA